MRGYWLILDRSLNSRQFLGWVKQGSTQLIPEYYRDVGIHSLTQPII